MIEKKRDDIRQTLQRAQSLVVVPGPVVVIHNFYIYLIMKTTNGRFGFGEMLASELVEGSTIPSPVTITKAQTVILVGTLLSCKEISSAILTDNSKIIGTIYGYQLVFFLTESPVGKLYANLFQPVGLLTERLPVVGIPSVSLRESCDSILKKIAQNRFGDVIITNEEGLPIGILSLSQIASCLALRMKTVGMKVRDVASKLKLSDEGRPLSEVLPYMLRHRIKKNRHQKKW